MAGRFLPASEKRAIYCGRMVDAIFGERRLAAVYDAFEGEQRPDLAVYEAIIAEFGATEVLDVGCGTGRLALRLAAKGLTVVGVDPAEASIEVARAKAGAENVTWVSGFADAAPECGADLAVMTGNAAQALLTEDDWAKLLTGVHKALRPGGYFVFEARRPERRIWEEWTDAVATSPGVERRFAVTEINPPFVSFRYTYRFAADNAVLHSDSTLWFRGEEEIRQTLLRYAFKVQEVREAPDRPGLENVFIATAG